jgi:pyruvate formate lyase activating enzyme
MNYDNTKQARYYNKIEKSKVHCYLCPHNCVIEPQMTGTCRARKNIDGELFSLNYGLITSLSLDPMEKKPLKRFHPGTLILSVGSFGCNLKCSFCQNWTIAHTDAGTAKLTPQALVSKAASLKAKGNIGIAYTYNEPSIWYEFVYDTCTLAKKEGLLNVLVTNGFISHKPLLDILPFVDAMNIDVKAFTAGFYKGICRGVLDNVKESVQLAAKHCHVEVTTLVIPDLNDSIDEIENLSKWLSSISPDIPLHLSRFFPNYKMSHINPTPKDTLFSVKKVADKYLNHVYLGNI